MLLCVLLCFFDLLPVVLISSSVVLLINTRSYAHAHIHTLKISSEREKVRARETRETRDERNKTRGKRQETRDKRQERADTVATFLNLQPALQALAHVLPTQTARDGKPQVDRLYAPGAPQSIAARLPAPDCASLRCAACRSWVRRRYGVCHVNVPCYCAEMCQLSVGKIGFGGRALAGGGL